MTKEKFAKYIVIGAGPAGLQLGYFLQKKGMDYVVLEQNEKAASFFMKYPRRRRLISFNKIYSIYDDKEVSLRWDWNSLLTDDYDHLFKDYSKDLYPHADDLVRYMHDFAEKYQINIEYSSKIIEIEKIDNSFVITGENGVHYRCEILIVATGIGKEYIPEIPGIDLVNHFYSNASTNPEDYIDKSVLVLGKGNSAFEMADMLLSTTKIVHLASPNNISMAWETRFNGNVRANYTSLLDTYQLKLLNGVLDCNVLSIEKVNNKFDVTVSYLHAQAEVETIVYDDIICCTGFMFDVSPFKDSCKPELSMCERLPAMDSSWQSPNVPNLYFAGTLMQARDRKSSTSFVDGFRYNAKSLVKILQARYEKMPLSNTEFSLSLTELYETIVSRVSRSSALWAQFGYLCDVVSIDKDKNTFKYYEEIPVDYVQDSLILNNDSNGADCYLIITFEWGKCRGNVFDIQRQPHYETAYTNVFLHPIIRCLNKDNALLSEHHILEDLFAVFNGKYETGMVKKRGGLNIEDYHYKHHDESLKNYLAKILSDEGMDSVEISSGR